MNPSRVCGAQNGTYSCQRLAHGSPQHRARFLSAGTPYVLLWGDGQTRSKLDRP
ncbi:MAG: hypothetical protein K0S70_148 [Microbacterium sp.]|nr:hypothetical protein [Microbacterium sp.]